MFELPHMMACLTFAALPLGLIVVDQEADLEQVRMHINRLWEDLSKTNNGSFPALSPDWCFLDCECVR